MKNLARVVRKLNTGREEGLVTRGTTLRTVMYSRAEPHL